MQLRYEIPDTFWSLFRSVNREIYMESLLVINEEYQYSNYFLTKEICVQVLSDMNAQKRISLEREENETDFDMLETTASRILRWLLKTGWLKKIEDYSTMTTNIVIPDYAAIFIEAFERLTSEELEETELYIQNVYATLFSFQNDSRVNLNMLRTALINTRKLNKALQDMLHNMDKFYSKAVRPALWYQSLRLTDNSSGSQLPAHIWNALCPYWRFCVQCHQIPVRSDPADLTHPLSYLLLLLLSAGCFQSILHFPAYPGDIS